MLKIICLGFFSAWWRSPALPSARLPSCWSSCLRKCCCHEPTKRLNPRLRPYGRLRRCRQHGRGLYDMGRFLAGVITTLVAAVIASAEFE